MRWTRSARHSLPRGITLIEVVAAILLLSVLLVGVLMGLERHSRQVRTAQAKLASCVLADQVVGSLFADPKEFGESEVGRVSEDSGSFVWRMSSMELPPELREVGVRKVRLTFDLDDEAQRERRAEVSLQLAGSLSTGPPLLTLEVLLPDPDWTAEGREHRTAKSYELVP